MTDSAAIRPRSAPLRVALAQFKPQKGRVRDNLARIRSWISAESGVTDVVVFPETAACGYFLEGGVVEAAMTAEDLAAALGPPTQDGAPDVVIGFYERWRQRLYNSLAYLAPVDGAFTVVHVHRKIFLPTYGVFDEARFVETGRDVRTFDTRFGRMGLLICEDMWHSLPATILALAGAEILLVGSASPARGFRPGAGRPGNLERWDMLARTTAQEHGVFVVVSQLVGSEGGKLFPGGSIAVGPDGQTLARGPLYDECVTRLALDGAELSRARFESPLLADLEQMLPHLQRSLAGTQGQLPERPLRGGDPSVKPTATPSPVDRSVLELDLAAVERTLVEFIREEVVRRRGFERVVLGVSGGVDSSVSLHLAVRALGPENVRAIRLPYAISSPESLEHADLVIKQTGAQAETIEITGPVDAYARHDPDITDLRRANLQARVRAVILFDQSAKHHALPLGTGNKSERLLGYYTWHADDSPPINPLGDLFKTQVWALARHLGIPEVIVEKPASADLIRGVTAQDELGVSYHDADLILYWLLEGYRPDELARCGFPAAKVELVWKRINSTHWKRELPT
ncbi:MAG: NAD+ synthase, partial [Gemmatimonadetes bacterium]|nr:NAD+ synthase [Gemmatimonadota bacterium]